MMEIDLHQIDTPNIDLFLASVAKIILPAMFKITPNDTDNIYILTYPFDPRFQTTNTAHQQIHFYTCPRSFIEQFNKMGVYNGVDLKNKMCLMTGLCVFNFASD